MHGTPTAPAGAIASIALGNRDDAGNWQMLVRASNLAKLRPGRYYTLWLTRKGRAVAPCGSFVVAAATRRPRPGSRWRTSSRASTAGSSPSRRAATARPDPCAAPHRLDRAKVGSGHQGEDRVSAEIRKPTIVLFAVLLSAFAAGCGGGSGSSESTRPRRPRPRPRPTSASPSAVGAVPGRRHGVPEAQ